MNRRFPVGAPLRARSGVARQTFERDGWRRRKRGAGAGRRRGGQVEAIRLAEGRVGRRAGDPLNLSEFFHCRLSPAELLEIDGDVLIYLRREPTRSDPLEPPPYESFQIRDCGESDRDIVPFPPVESRGDEPKIVGWNVDRVLGAKPTESPLPGEVSHVAAGQEQLPD